MNASISLAVLVTMIFALLGTAKIMALPPMRELAAESGFSVDAYRSIGVLEVAGAVGVALGLAVPLPGCCSYSPAPSSPTSGKDTGRASTRPSSSAAFSSPATSPR
jgi:hypothetical protein